MGLEAGVLFALGALVFWGLGDFLIQRSTRKVGDWETLFVITMFGAVVLAPFAYKDMGSLFSADGTFFILTGVSVTLLVAAMLDFEALKKGKLAVVDPLLALEVPVSAALAFGIFSEALKPLETILVSALVIGIVMISLRSHHFSRCKWIERGVVLVVVGSVFMGMSNFLVGFASRVTNPLLANWFINIFLAMISFFYLMSNMRLHRLATDFRSNKRLLLTVSTFDNAAWVCFAFAASLIPIAIAVALSESYIALAALLGLLINKEILMSHQKLGLAVTLSSALVLAALY